MPADGIEPRVAEREAGLHRVMVGPDLHLARTVILAMGAGRICSAQSLFGVSSSNERTRGIRISSRKSL